MPPARSVFESGDRLLIAPLVAVLQIRVAYYRVGLCGCTRQLRKTAGSNKPTNRQMHYLSTALMEQRYTRSSFSVADCGKIIVAHQC